MVDLTRRDTNPARLLDLIPGRSGKAYADWLSGRGDTFTAGIRTATLDPFRGHSNAIRDETWFIECKHYRRGVPPDKIAGLITWATAERPDVALIIASNYLSNPCKDWIKRTVDQNRPPFRIT